MYRDSELILHQNTGFSQSEVDTDDTYCIRVPGFRFPRGRGHLPNPDRKMFLGMVSPRLALHSGAAALLTPSVNANVTLLDCFR